MGHHPGPTMGAYSENPNTTLGLSVLRLWPSLLSLYFSQFKTWLLQHWVHPAETKPGVLIYTPWAIKTCHFILDHNSCISWWISTLCAHIKTGRNTLSGNYKICNIITI